MKKVYLFLALCLAFVASSVQVKADYWEMEGYDQLSNPFPVVTEIKTDVWYALGTSRTLNDGSQYAYLSEAGMTLVKNESTLWKFEVYGQDSDGNTIYVLRQKASDKLLAKGFNLTSSADDAFHFTALKAEVVENNADPEDESTFIDWSEYDSRNHTASRSNNDSYYLIDEIYDNTFVICESPVNQENPTFLSCIGAFAGYHDTNNWAIYPTRKATGEEAVQACFDDVFGSVEFDIDNYEVGDGPGQFDEQALNEMAEAWAEFAEYLGGGGSDEDCYAAIDKVIAAWENLQNHMGGMKDGQYYRFWNWRDDFTACMYDGNGDLKWTPSYEAPEEIDAEGTQYIWKVVEKDGKYYFQNYFTDRYIKDVAGFSAKFSTTTEPETGFVLVPSDMAGTFNLRGDERADNYGMHTQVNGNVVVYWYAGTASDNQGSLWKVEVIDKEVIQGLEDLLVQKRLNDELANVYEKAYASYLRAESECYSSDMTRDAEFPVDGLVTSGEQFRSVSSDQDEGNDAEVLFDGEMGNASYWHSDWHSAVPDEGHSFVVDLGEPLDLISMKIASRQHQNDDYPTVMKIYGSNERPALFDEPFDYSIREDETDYTECGEIRLSYDISYNPGNAHALVGIGVAKLDAPYQYLKFVETDNGRHQNRIVMCELRIYKTTADWTQGNLSAMDPAVLKEFQDALEAAKDALNDEAATEALIERLTKAYEAFLEGYPDPMVLRELLAEAQNWLETAIEGEEAGTYPAEAIAALQKVVDETVVEDVMTLEALNAGKKAVTDAINAFKNALNLPAAGNYFIISQSEGAPGLNYMRAGRPGHSQAQWGGYNTEGGYTESYVSDMQNINYLWKLAKKGERTYTLYNYGTGTYLAKVEENNEPLMMTTNAEEALEVVLQSARIAETPAFNIVCAEGIYLNFQPGTYNMVTWNSAQGADNSSLVFEEVDLEDWDGQNVVSYSDAMPSIVTVPYEVKLEDMNQPLYKLLGQNAEGDYIFKEYTSADVVPAATPMLLVPNGTDEDHLLYLDPTAAAVDQIQFTYGTFFNQNGMVGVLENATLPEGCGIFKSNVWSLQQRLSTTSEGDVVASGTGYFAVSDLTAETGDLTIKGVSGLNKKFEETIGVNTVIVNNKTTRGTFNLMGQKVVGKLPAGLYIIDGQKYIVK